MKRKREKDDSDESGNAKAFLRTTETSKVEVKTDPDAEVDRLLDDVKAEEIASESLFNRRTSTPTPTRPYTKFGTHNICVLFTSPVGDLRQRRCRMCLSAEAERSSAEEPIPIFSVAAHTPTAVMIKHCMEEHPVAFEDMMKMDDRVLESLVPLSRD